MPELPQEKTFCCQEPNGRIVLRTAAEIVALNRSYYDTVAKQWKKGDPSAAGSNALTGNKRRWGGAISIPPPPPPTINWQSVPSYDLGSGDAYFKGGYYRKEGHNQLAFHAGDNKTGRIILEDFVIWSDGPAVAAYRGKAKLKNGIIIITPPTVYGQENPRSINMEYWRDLDMENVTIIGGRQINLTGYQGQFFGDRGAGQGLRMVGVKWHNISGVRAGVRSNWGETHQYNTIRTGQGGEIGWDVANLVQINSAPRINLQIQWCEVLTDQPGRGRTEDTISIYGGSGGHEANPGLIADNLLEASGGYDWNYVHGVSTTYDSSNRVTANPTSPQTVSETRYSGTSLLVGDAHRSIYEDNTSYVVAARNVAIGARPYVSTQAGHHNSFIGNKLIECDRHWRTGVPYSGYYEGYYQINASQTQTSSGQRIFGALTFVDNDLHRLSFTGDSPLTLSADHMTNGGTQSGNMHRVKVTDGGAAAVAAYRARRAAAGVTCGSTLPVPADVKQWESKA